MAPFFAIMVIGWLVNLLYEYTVRRKSESSFKALLVKTRKEINDAEI
jgi:hypothetical protein